MGGYLGFVLQAFSHDWVTYDARPPSLHPYNYIPVVGGLTIQPVSSFTMEPSKTLAFYTKAVFTPAASGEYSIVFEFQATVQSSS
jgi:hypothetical protein